MDVLTPELALVDPQLAAAARLQLPDPGDCLASRARAPCAEPPPPQAASSSSHRPSRTVVVASLLVAVIVGSPAVDLIPRSSAGPTFAEAPDVPAPSVEVEKRTSDGATELRWASVTGADFYDVVFWRDGKRVLDAWPRANSLLVPEDGRLEAGTLEAGNYLWFVYAGFEGDGAARFGGLLANGELEVTRTTPLRQE